MFTKSASDIHVCSESGLQKWIRSARTNRGSSGLACQIGVSLNPGDHGITSGYSLVQEEYIFGLEKIPKCPKCGVLLTRYRVQWRENAEFVYDADLNGYRTTKEDDDQTTTCANCNTELPDDIDGILYDNTQDGIGTGKNYVKRSDLLSNSD
jgi:hypothetical protein